MAAHRPTDRSASDDTQMNLRDLWQTLLHRWRLLFGVAGVVVAVALAVVLLVRPWYESEAVLRVKSDRPGGGMLEEMLPAAALALPGLGDADVETEMGVLRSRRVADAVVDSLALHVELAAPARPRSEVLRLVRAGEGAQRGVYTLRRRADGGYDVSASRTRGAVELPARVEIGEPFRLANATFSLHPALRADPPREIRIRVRPYARVVRELGEDLRVGRQEGRSKLVEIRYRNRDAELAASVVNGVISHFMEYSERTGKTESRRTVGVLREQIAQYEGQLRVAEDRLQAYQEAERIVAPVEQATVQVKRIAEVQAVHDAMSVERNALATLLAQVGSRAARGEGARPYRQLATFPSFISNGAVQDVLQALTELDSKRAELIAQRTEQNADVRTVDTRIRELEGQLYTLGTSYVGSLDNQLASAGVALGTFGRELEALPAREVEYARLTRERKLLSEVYVRLQARLKEAEVQEAIDDAAVRVVDHAIVADRAAFPRPTISLVLASVLGVMLGLISVVASEVMSPSVRSRRDAESAAAGAPVLGVIPHIESVSPRSNGAGASTSFALPRLRLSRGAAVPGERLVVRRDPWHPASEAFRALGNTLTLQGEGVTPRLLVVTSALPGEGKSTVAANLALTLAQQGHRTLLLDADLRNGALERVFAAERGPGWTGVVTGGASLDEALREVSAAPDGVLHLLPAGAMARHPASLLESQALRTLLAELRERYDVVVLDAPPLAAANDAAMLAMRADATVLVARSGETGKEALENATLQLADVRAAVLGIVLNDVHLGRRAYGARRERGLAEVG